jgi:DNA gyrase subunit A
VAGQGNFGSIDGDSAAAYRYTEARLAPIAGEMLADIDKETVEFTPNFDDRLQEPTVLPARLPNLLINGSSGIAVGMSTNVPPHNLREVVDAALHLLDHPECTVEDLMAFVPGPDFPTGGIVVGTKGVRQAYETGRGRVVIRARVVREQRRGGREQLVVTEIPYAANKTRIIEQIADLAKRAKLPDVSDLRDESDRDGIRLVVELKRGGDAVRTLDLLFKWTGLQSTFGVITLALDGGVPREFSLKRLLERYRDHRIEVVVRRSRWALEKARDEAHILEGLLVALKNIDEVVRLIRGSKTRESASAKLQKQFRLTEPQAAAILSMRLARLTQLETRELKERLAELALRIRELESILASPERQLSVIREELGSLRETYGDARRTRIVADEKVLTLDEVVADEEVAVTISSQGFAKLIPVALLRRRLSSGRALAGLDRYEDDHLRQLIRTSTNDLLLVFSSDGRAHWLPTAEIPEAGPASRGRPVQQMLGLPRRAGLVSVMVMPRDPAERLLVFATAGGTVKRTRLDEFSRPRAGGIAAIQVADGDELLSVALSDGQADLVLASSAGRAIVFPEADVSVMGRAAQGVRGMKLARGERLVGAFPARRDSVLGLVTRGGFAKRVPVAELATQRRDGLGAVVVPLDGQTGPVVGALDWAEGVDLLAAAAGGAAVRLRAADVPPDDRGAPGVPLLSDGWPEGVHVSVTPAAERERPRVPVGEPGPEEAEGEEADDAQNDELLDGTDDEADGGPALDDVPSEEDGSAPSGAAVTQFDLLEP